MSNQKIEQVDDTLEAMLTRAKNGDAIAAKGALSFIADALSATAPFDTKLYKKGDPLPVPMFVRTYLSEALRKIDGGAKVGEALYFNPPHAKNKHDYVDLMRAAVWMRCYMDCINDGTSKKFTKKEAAKKAVSEYNENQRFLKSNSPTLTQRAVTDFYDSNASEIDAKAKKCLQRNIHKAQ